MERLAMCAGVLIALALAAAPASATPPAEAAIPVANPPVGVPALAEVAAGPVHEYLQRSVRYGLSGAAVLVRGGGEVIGAGGYGLADRDSEDPNTLATLFDVGAISMQFTAAAILRLEMEGRLKVDDPVGRYFDETVVGNIPPESAAITLHQLLSHTSGLRGANLRDLDLTDRDAVVTAILSNPGPFKPGTSFGFTGANYCILAAIVERVSGRDFEDAMRELVFQPAGMTDTTFYGDWDAAAVAHGHEDLPRRGGEDGEEIEPIGSIGPPNERDFDWSSKGAGGILSSARDLYRWHVALTGDTLLSAEAKKRFFTAVRQNHAYGWEVHNLEEDEGGGFLLKCAGIPVGFEALFARWIGPDGSDRGALILLLNTRRGMAQRLQPPLQRFVLGSSGDVAPQPPPLRAADVALPAGAIGRAAGIYRLPSGGAIELVVSEGKLIAVPAGQDASALLNVPTQHLAPVLGNASARTAQVLGALVKGDDRSLAFFRDSLHPQVPEGSGDRWIERWAGPSRADNPLTGVEVLGSFVGDDGLQSVARLRSRDGEAETVRIFWKQDQVYGIGAYDPLEGIRTDEDATRPVNPRLATRSPGLAVELVPESETSFAAIDAGKWGVLRMTLQPGPDGVPAAMKIVSGDQTVTATRE